MEIDTRTTETPPAPDRREGFDAAYDRLVEARLDYETLKTHKASTGRLSEARAALQRARSQMDFQRNLRIS